MKIIVVLNLFLSISVFSQEVKRKTKLEFENALIEKTDSVSLHLLEGKARGVSSEIPEDALLKREQFRKKFKRQKQEMEMSE